MSIMALAILAPIRALFLMSQAWLIGFLEEPPNGAYSTEQGSFLLPFTLAVISVVIAGGCLRWVLQRRKGPRP